MKPRSIFSIICVVSMGALLLSCGGMEEGDQFGSVSQTAKMVCSSPTVVKLLAADSTQVGSVMLRNNKGKLFVTYTLTNGYKLVNTRFHVARKVSQIPQFKNGKFRQNKFRYRNIHKKRPTKFTRGIKLRKKWKPGVSLVVAVFAKVIKSGTKSNTWIENSYTSYKVGECYLDAVLPTTPVSMYVGSSKYAKLGLNLSKVGDGFDVWNGHWPGWCVEKTVYIRTGKLYSAKVVSSQDTANLPDRAKNVNWQLVNYIINNKHPKATTTDVQNAVWHVLGYIGAPSDKEAKWMVNKAKANGKGFRPTYGDSVAAIFLSNVGTQLVFLEVAL